MYFNTPYRARILSSILVVALVIYGGQIKTRKLSVIFSPQYCINNTDLLLFTFPPKDSTKCWFILAIVNYNVHGTMQVSIEIWYLKLISTLIPDIKFMKQIIHTIVEPLTRIFNLSFPQGKIPHQLKNSRVIPIYKSGLHTSLDNYRPIGLISVISKIQIKQFVTVSQITLNITILFTNINMGLRKITQLII